MLRRSVFATCRPLISQWALGSLLGICVYGAGAAAVSPERADLSLPPLVTPPSLALKPGGMATADALAHFSTAMQFEAAGKLRDALPHYLAVLEADPANSTLALHTAELAYNFKGRAEAISLLEKAVASRPDDPAAYINLARFCTTYAPDDPFERDRASQVLEQALKKFPKSAEVYTFASLMYLTKSMRDEAIKVLNQAEAQDITDPQYWLEIGRTAQQVWPMGQSEMREEHQRLVNPFFEKALHNANGKAGDPVRLEVAQYYLLTNQLDRARALCEEIAAQSGNLQARKLLYRLYEAAGLRGKALTLLEKIVKDAPNDVEMRRLLATAYQVREEYAKSVPHLEAAIQLGGGDVEDYLKLGEMLLRSEMYDKLIQLSERSIKLFPDQVMFYVNAAYGQRALMHMDKAIALFAEAAELVESSQSEFKTHRFYFQYGITLERGGRHEEAGRILEKAINLTPKDDYEEAASTMNYLGYMWLELGKYSDKAGELIRKANELMPDNAAYIDSLGWWYYKTGDYPNAQKELQRAISLLKEMQPDDAEIIEHLAWVYLKLNDPAKARENFIKARDLQPPDEKVRTRIEDALKDLSGKVPAPAPAPAPKALIKPPAMLEKKAD